MSLPACMPVKASGVVCWMQTYKAVPGAVHTLALAYMSLSAAQMALRRPEDVEASLQRGVDVTTCALLQRAHYQADLSNSSPSERQGPV